MGQWPYSAKSLEIKKKEAFLLIRQNHTKPRKFEKMSCGFDVDLGSRPAAERSDAELHLFRRSLRKMARRQGSICFHLGVSLRRRSQRPCARSVGSASEPAFMSRWDTITMYTTRYAAVFFPKKKTAQY